MRNLVKTMMALVLMFFSVRAMAIEFDIESYDSDVTNYVLEVHERLLKTDIAEEDFKKFYNKLATAPSADTLAGVTTDLLMKAKSEGKGLTDQAFVIFVHRVVLGQFSLRRNYSRDMVNGDLARLESKEITQEGLLKERLASEMGQDRMEELMAGDIQQERFSKFRILANE